VPALSTFFGRASRGHLGEPSQHANDSQPGLKELGTFALKVQPPHKQSDSTAEG